MPEDVVQTGRPAPRQPRPGTPRWVKVFAVIGALFAVLVVLMLTGVLGKGHGPGRHFGGMRSESTGVGGPAEADDAARSTEVVTLDSMAFSPASVEVSAGETVTFVVTNSGKIVHEFTLGDAAMHTEHAQMMSHIPAGRAHDTPNSIVLQPGQTKELTWRFGDSSLEYACHQSGHYEAGMHGRITIA